MSQTLFLHVRSVLHSLLWLPAAAHATFKSLVSLAHKGSAAYYLQAVVRHTTRTLYPDILSRLAVLPQFPWTRLVISTPAPQILWWSNLTA